MVLLFVFTSRMFFFDTLKSFIILRFYKFPLFLRQEISNFYGFHFKQVSVSITFSFLIMHLSIHMYPSVTINAKFAKDIYDIMYYYYFWEGQVENVSKEGCCAFSDKPILSWVHEKCALPFFFFFFKRLVASSRLAIYVTDVVTKFQVILRISCKALSCFPKILTKFIYANLRLTMN